ncbi:hypothetical protein EW026_g5390 [Hermanssonia centrifuga]|uniref:Uncharacterized protein n=1 Tax=Hermanssonia centrifuga TaxID=98765 RepID=A0A4V3XA26_9APHY|nr:hypothetical protein EW026_g5390 [Hermanssonia centrifuga]
MQFSPDGKSLATSSWDRTVRILGVETAPFASKQILPHPRGVVKKVVWSPNGEILLTIVARDINVWTKAGLRKGIIKRSHTVKSISWMPDNNEFLSIEDSKIVKLDLNGNLLDTYPLERINIQDAAVTTDGRRIIAVGDLTESPNGLKPKKGQTEKQIIVFNLERNQIEQCVLLVYHQYFEGLTDQEADV